ncbi:MAG: HAMP domain-containing protein [Leptospiraceae bacterium]|nr:HAMP domain-containing protein [Leptospiraceae bacterium]
MKRLTSFSLGARIGLAVFGLTLLISGSSSAFYYYSTRNFVIKQMGGRLLDIGRTGAWLFGPDERAAIIELHSRVLRKRAPLSKSDLDLGAEDTLAALNQEDAEEIMRSTAFQSLVQNLRQIKDGSRRGIHPLRTLPQLPEDSNDVPLVRYAYLLVSIPDSTDHTITMFLADADYARIDENQDGIIADDESGNPIGTLWRTPLAEFKQAFDGEAIAGSEWYTDNWGTWLSAAIPIKNRAGRVIAVLGLDYDIRGEANLLHQFQQVAIAMIVAGSMLAVVLGILIAQLLKYRLRPLVQGVARMAQRDYSVHLPIKSSDEVGQLARGFNEMVSVIKAHADSLEVQNKAIERFVPREFLQQMGHETVLTVSLGDAVERAMTVMFCDIRSFTSLSEQMTPAENFRFLNEYLSRISPIIRENHGFIDKYIGDAVMALFPQSPRDALRAASQMQMELALFNAEKKEAGAEPIRFGIGLHFGQLTLGAVGEENRLEGTVISDAVNVAARLEHLTKQARVNVLFSEDLLQRLGDEARYFKFRPLGDIRLRGRRERTRIYEFLEGLPAEEIQRRLDAGPRIATALQAVRSGNREQALELLEQALTEMPSDEAMQSIYQKIKGRPA